MNIRAICAALGSLLFSASDSNWPDGVENRDVLPQKGHLCWQQIWGDEFDGDRLDPAKWTGVKNGPRGNGMWGADHLQVHGGVAEFIVSRQSGRVITAGTSTEQRFAAQGGYFVMRARLPTAPGYRSAFWLSSEHINEVDHPGRPTEVDIMEYPGRNGRIRQNLHWNGYGKEHRTVGKGVKQSLDTTRFHTFGVWWHEDGYDFYVDGRRTWRATGGGVSTLAQFIRLGNEPLPEDPIRPIATDAELKAAQNYMVDYIRVYQQKPCRMLW